MTRRIEPRAWPCAILLLAAGQIASSGTSAAPKQRETQVRVPVWIEIEEPPAAVKPVFTARLDGAPSPILDTQAPAGDLVILVVLDLTGDIARVDAARAALVQQFEKLPENAWVGILRAQDGLRVLVDPTADRKALAASLQSLVVSGKAAFFDTVETAGELADRMGRKSTVRVAVLYVTDSDIYNYRQDYTNPVINSSDPHDLSRRFADSLIQAKVSKLRETLGAQQTPLFVVHLNYRYDRLNDAYENGIRALAETTAGTALFCRSETESPEAISKAFDTIRSAWNLTLGLPKKPPGSLQVRLSAKGADGGELRLSYRARIALKRR